MKDKQTFYIFSHKKKAIKYFYAMDHFLYLYFPFNFTASFILLFVLLLGGGDSGGEYCVKIMVLKCFKIRSISFIV